MKFFERFKGVHRDEMTPDQQAEGDREAANNLKRLNEEYPHKGDIVVGANDEVLADSEIKTRHEDSVEVVSKEEAEGDSKKE